MSLEKATAIVLRAVPWSETSYVVTLYTREFGKVRAVAKGGRRPKGPFESALDLLALCRVVFVRKASDALDLLTEARLERRFRPPRRELTHLYAAYYVAELLDTLTDDYDPHITLFDAAEAALLHLSVEGAVAPPVLRFELLALDAVGHLPTLTTCADCGKEIGAASRVPFGPLAGGVLCTSCRLGKQHIISVSAAAIETLVRFADATSDSWRQTEIERRLLGELRGVMNRYLSHLIGHQPKMHRYLGILSD